jgi:hypothetical protein
MQIAICAFAFAFLLSSSEAFNAYPASLTRIERRHRFTLNSLSSSNPRSCGKFFTMPNRGFNERSLQRSTAMLRSMGQEIDGLESDPTNGEADASTQLIEPSTTNSETGENSVSLLQVALPTPSSLVRTTLFILLCCLSVVICYADRANIADAILPMSEQYGWRKSVNGLVLSSFFIGYAFTQVLPFITRRSALLANEN